MTDPINFKKKVALFLNENPGFFNDYPELLIKIKLHEPEDATLSSLNSLNEPEQFVLRDQKDQKQTPSQLKSFIDLARNNERIHNRLYEIERMALTSTDLLTMINQLKSKLIRYFEIQEVIVYLADGSDLFVGKKLKARFPETIDGALRFVEQTTLREWFAQGVGPIMKSEVDQDSKVFGSKRFKDLVRSEVLLPIVVRGLLVGCLALGCHTPNHFHPELSSGFISRMAGKIAIAIDNILLVQELKQRSFIDPQTGIYNHSYLSPLLVREFDRAERSGKNISSIMMSIDYLENLSHTGDESTRNTVLIEVGNVLSGSCRLMDVIIRYDDTKFFVLLPESTAREANNVGNRIQRGIESQVFPISFNGGKLTVSLGFASYPSALVKTHQDLVHCTFHSLSKAMAKNGIRAVVA